MISPRIRCVKSTRNPRIFTCIRAHSDRVSGCAGFTLIELLVVITILGILMGLGFSGVSAIRSQAKTAQARNDCAAISTAILQFYGDYNRYPTAKQEDAVYEPSDEAAGGNIEVIRVLTAQDTALNPRQIVYYDGKNAKRSKQTGKYEAGLGDGALFDPWGKTYGIVMDSNYDGKLIYQGSGLKDLNEDSRRIPGGVGVFSLGKDGQKGILSWGN
jgi:prepilin-type N-terminal cleavage/methylation domain-containing protein